MPWFKKEHGGGGECIEEGSPPHNIGGEKDGLNQKNPEREWGSI